MIKPDWNVFKTNFSENPQKNFEWLCYLLFCREFKRDMGIFRFRNQPAIEADLIHDGDDYIGFQAKFYEGERLTSKKSEIIEVIEESRNNYTDITKLYFYTELDWTFSSKAPDLKTEAQRKIEEFAKSIGITIEWRTASFFESPFVTVENSDITQYFFSIKTNEYYEKIRSRNKQHLEISEEEKYITLLKVKENESAPNKYSLYEYIDASLRKNGVQDFQNIFVKGIAGVSKSVEMKFAYNKLLEKCSSQDSYHDYCFLPTPYFFELKNYQEGCFINITDETPLLFLDGLDEISDSKVVILVKELHNLQAKNGGCRFIVSGRDASFIDDVKKFEHIEVKLFSYIDYELQMLIYWYKGSPLESLVAIPFYRNFAASDEARSLRTYKAFIEALVLKKLNDDKTRFDRSENNSSIRQNCSKINLESLQENLACFAYDIFKSKYLVFTKDAVFESLQNKDEARFFVNSSLVDYRDEKHISFTSNIYFEYFLAKYYSTHSYSLIQKDLFLSTGRVIVRHINVISILLNLLDSKSCKYKRLERKLRKESPAYILLSDYENLTANQRFHWYNKVIQKYNSQNRIIYYARFSCSHDILANVDSLSDKLMDLLPEEFADEAFQSHLQTINVFLSSPTSEGLMVFANSVILLGVSGRKIWNETQAEKLREISVPLIRFFFFHSLAKSIKGLLSARCVFNWYEAYNLSAGWSMDDWQQFIKDIYPQTSDGFYSFSSAIDHDIKMLLFMYLYKNKHIWKFYLSLAKYLLSNSMDFVPSSSVIPKEIDDGYEIKTVNIGGDDFYLTAIIKQEDIDTDGLFEILRHFSIEKKVAHNLGYEAQELLNEIKTKFKAQIQKIGIEKTHDLYAIGVNYLEYENGMYSNVLDDYIKLLSDSIKQAIYLNLKSDLYEGKYQTSWNIGRNIALLLDIENFETAKELLFELKTDMTNDVYQNTIAELNAAAFENHVLHNFAVKEYPKLFPEEVKRKGLHNERYEKVRNAIKSMRGKEAGVIISKSNILEITKSIFAYIDAHQEFETGKSEKVKLLFLNPSHVADSIQYDYRNKKIIPEIFSEFVVKMLADNAFNDAEKVDREAFENYIENAFADEKYFWRFFFYNYIERHNSEETKGFLKHNPIIIEKIKASMELEVKELVQKQDISAYDGGGNRYWVYPFICYVSYIYNGVLPDWFEKKYLLNFIAYPAWQLGYGIKNDFNWQKWNSVFDWIKSLSGYEESVLIQKALEIYPMLRSDQSKTQVISCFIDKLDLCPNLKERMTNLIIQESLVEAKKDYESVNALTIMNCNVLHSYWNRNENSDFIPTLIDILPFDEYRIDDNNYTRKTMIEYFCRVADMQHKTAVIEKLKKNKTVDNSKRILLAKLGDEDSIISLINSYLAGSNFDESIFYESSAFGAKNPSNRLIKKYMQLFEYSMEKQCKRRDDLHALSLSAIKKSATKKNYAIIVRCMKRAVAKQHKTERFLEYYNDILDEIEQNVFYKESP